MDGESECLGLVRASGRLGDGQPLSIGGVVRNDQRWAVYARPYLNQGLLGGTLTFEPRADSAIESNRWQLELAKALFEDQAYPAGFSGSIAGRRRPLHTACTRQGSVGNQRLELGARSQCADQAGDGHRHARSAQPLHANGLRIHRNIANTRSSDGIAGWPIHTDGASVRAVQRVSYSSGNGLAAASISLPDRSAP
jgi:hypothetical protein